MKKVHFFMMKEFDRRDSPEAGHTQFGLFD